METHTYPHLPAEVSTVHIALYSNVLNSKELKERLVTASNLPGPDGDREREVVNYAFVDAKLVRFPPYSTATYGLSYRYR